MTCARTAHLEAAVAGELPPAVLAELRAHASSCARCRHELRWLETEQTLFRQRAARDEVASLWSDFERRQGKTAAPRTVPLARRAQVVFAAAAALLLVVSVGRALRSASSDDALQSDAMMSPDLELVQSRETPPTQALMSTTSATFGQPACSRLPSGQGFSCGPIVMASR